MPYSVSNMNSKQSFKGLESMDDVNEANVVVNGGSGRIGKTFVREYLAGHFLPKGINNSWDAYNRVYGNLNLVAINLGSFGLKLKEGKNIKDVPLESIENLYRNDSVMGKLPDAIRLEAIRNEEGTFLQVESQFGKPELIKLVATHDNLDYSDVNAEILLDATGKKTNRAELLALKNATPNAQFALLSAPAKEKDKSVKEMPTVVSGVNDNAIKNIREEGIGSAASCTTTCISPVIKLLNDEFGVVNGFINTVHAGTLTQKLADKQLHTSDSKDRASFNSIIPTTTGAAKAVGKVLPELNGKLDGQADRVPTTDGSLAVIDLTLSKPTTKDEVLEMFQKAAKDPAYRDLIAIADKGSSSVDVIGRHESAMIVPESIKVIGGNRVIVKAYYDNEAGYTRSYASLASKLANTVIERKGGDPYGSGAEHRGNSISNVETEVVLPFPGQSVEKTPAVKPEKDDTNYGEPGADPRDFDPDRLQRIDD